MHSRSVFPTIYFYQLIQTATKRTFIKFPCVVKWVSVFCPDTCYRIYWVEHGLLDVSEFPAENCRELNVCASCVTISCRLHLCRAETFCDSTRNFSLAKSISSPYINDPNCKGPLVSKRYAAHYIYVIPVYGMRTWMHVSGFCSSC